MKPPILLLNLGKLGTQRRERGHVSALHRLCGTPSAARAITVRKRFWQAWRHRIGTMASPRTRRQWLHDVRCRAPPPAWARFAARRPPPRSLSPLGALTFRPRTRGLELTLGLRLRLSTAGHRLLLPRHQLLVQRRALVPARAHASVRARLRRRCSRCRCAAQAGHERRKAQTSLVEQLEVQRVPLPLPARAMRNKLRQKRSSSPPPPSFKEVAAAAAASATAARRCRLDCPPRSISTMSPNCTQRALAPPEPRLGAQFGT